MTIANFIVLTRPELGDEVSPYRWSDAKIIRYINACRRALWSTHPEAFHVSTIVTELPADLADGGTLDIIDPFINRMMHFVCGEIFSEDSDDAANPANAKMHKDQFLFGGM